jgi:hypothetical protein
LLGRCRESTPKASLFMVTSGSTGSLIKSQSNIPAEEELSWTTMRPTDLSLDWSSWKSRKAKSARVCTHWPCTSLHRMVRKNAAQKRQFLLQFSEGLKQFRPWEADSFLCPICLKAISASKKEEISVAHIIPNASAGKPVTLLCRECNSFFGANQDRWFGNYRRMRHARGGWDNI